MVFLVDHHADRFLGIEGDAARAIEHGGEFAADELPFDEELPVEGRHGRHVEVIELVRQSRPWRWRLSRGVTISPFWECWPGW